MREGLPGASHGAVEKEAAYASWRARGEPRAAGMYLTRRYHLGNENMEEREVSGNRVLGHPHV